jgi:hypothetical protein
MVRTGIVVMAAALVAGLSFATDASAAGRGKQGARMPMAKSGSSQKSALPSRVNPNSNNGSYGRHGPYIGVKWIGKI